MKLYLILLKGMRSSPSGPVYGQCYVVAKGLDEAYSKVRKKLDEWDVGFTIDRNLDSITLIADEEQYGVSPTILYL